MNNKGRYFLITFIVVTRERSLHWAALAILLIKWMARWLEGRIFTQCIYTCCIFTLKFIIHCYTNFFSPAQVFSLPHLITQLWYILPIMQGNGCGRSEYANSQLFSSIHINQEINFEIIMHFQVTMMTRIPSFGPITASFALLEVQLLL